MQFGIFLLKRGVVTTDQFIEAISQQARQRVPLGQLAVDADRMTKIHLLHILSVQSKENRLFGQIALDLGYLTKQDLAELFLEQDMALTPLGEILVDLGALSKDKMQSELREYRRELADEMDPSGVLSTVV